MHEEKKNKNKKEDAMPEGAVPPYLLDREGVSRAKVPFLTLAAANTPSIENAPSTNPTHVS